MAMDTETFAAILANMRERFLQELDERCNKLEELILSLERDGANKEVFNELYRGIHNVKGAGGTHGLNVVTTICHQLESFLAELGANAALDASSANNALAYLDLLRRVSVVHRSELMQQSDIESELERLNHRVLEKRKSGLLAESSQTLASYYQQALEPLPVRLVWEQNGLNALGRLLREHFDFIIAGGELKELNSLAVVAALRASQARNHKIPAILITSRQGLKPEEIQFDAILTKNKELPENLLSAVRKALSL
ncbi:Hpt domain-containing protein [Hahella aquimaris]|uniref:Hpt domain-containing protein n=1 Tax=Hahella sp. HNIBRBA332 TaxID=3015983 RepID=UPI00273C92E6|nr:Hpt domain-containing protein [Hahella sp. HNIBRBA332]WLQ17018.1 Hpt domain-containing protein [Hahella sp. HNIBRBA332]